LNQCISFMRRQRHFEEEEDVAVDDAGWENNARLQAIYRAQQSLLGPQRISFHLFYVEQWSLEEIADVLDCGLGTVKSHLHRAREKVRGHQEVQKWNIRI
jgi:RNA polymerase sigma factor (sigma-70 family)